MDSETLLTTVVYVVLAGIAEYIVHTKRVAEKLTYEKQLAYNNFADKRHICCVPNFADVASNLAFIAAGVYHIYNNSPPVGVMAIFVGIGSIYYHLNPTMETLYWDRVPMVAFMAHLVSCATYIPYPIMFVVGMTTLEYHKQAYSLSHYSAFQLSAVLLFGCMWNLNMYIPAMFYVLAKVCEDYDRAIYAATANIISGHTIKHLLSGLAMFFISDAIFSSKGIMLWLLGNCALWS